MDVLTNTWMNNPTFLACCAHCFGALAIVMVVAYLWNRKAALWAAGLFTVYAVVKEYWYDLVYELPKQSFGDSTLDLVFYLLGLGAALGLILWVKPKLTSPAHSDPTP